MGLSLYHQRRNLKKNYSNSEKRWWTTKLPSTFKEKSPQKHPKSPEKPQSNKPPTSEETWWHLTSPLKTTLNNSPPKISYQDCPKVTNREFPRKRWRKEPKRITVNFLRFNKKRTKGKNRKRYKNVCRKRRNMHSSLKIEIDEILLCWMNIKNLFFVMN